MMQEWEPRSLLKLAVATICIEATVGSHFSTITSDYIIATITSDTTVAFDVIVGFISLEAILTSTPVMWREGHLSNFCVLQRVHLHLALTVFEIIKQKLFSCCII
jgi:hypothetical protein